MPPAFRKRLDARGDIHAVAQYVIPLLDDIARMQTNPDVDLAVR
jgi:hypothetical protein